MLSGTLYRNERNIVLRCVKLATVVSARRSVSGWRVLCGSAYVARHLQTLLSRPFPSPPPPPFFVVGCAHCQSSHFSFWRVSSDPKNHPAVSRAETASAMVRHCFAFVGGPYSATAALSRWISSAVQVAPVMPTTRSRTQFGRPVRPREKPSKAPACNRENATNEVVKTLSSGQKSIYPRRTHPHSKRNI